MILSDIADGDGDRLQVMTSVCLFSVDTGDHGRPSASLETDVARKAILHSSRSPE